MVAAGGGDPRSKRSVIVLVATGGLFVALEKDGTAAGGAGGDAADEKSPKSPPKLSLRACGEGLLGAAGLESKKEPPLSADLFVVDGWRVWPAGGEKLENGAGFGWLC